MEKYSQFFISLFCMIPFVIQVYQVTETWMHPTQLTTEITSEKFENLELSGFPFIFKICGNPAFNLTALKEENYKDSNSYFFGSCQNESSDSHVYGWACSSNASAKTVKGFET